ncbi:MAG: GTP-binding protein [Chloroflexi bacterium]|jgi:GTP-binding protein|nr:MAG: GTP-binding protein [Chloroflexota bacterium]
MLWEKERGPLFAAPTNLLQSISAGHLGQHFFADKPQEEIATSTRTDIRNVAIIAHVDHGKTTLVDALLKQSHVFRDNQHVGVLIMDSNPLEQERGITILAKNTAVTYQDIKINIIDTPGHADFSGEVERVLNMADGCLLVVDAVDGPMPQTRYVLKKALDNGLRPVVVINKIDRPTARVPVVEAMVQDLFLELATEAEQLDFPVLYASAREGYAVAHMDDERKDVMPLFEAIRRQVPAPSGDSAAPLQLLVAALDYDNHLGQIAIGRISQGTISLGEEVACISADEKMESFKVDRLYVFEGLGRKEVDKVEAGDIVALAGIDKVAIGNTIASVEFPEALPVITIDEPTVSVTFGVNTSPVAGREGRSSMSRQIYARLMRELKTNLSLRVQETGSPDTFLVSGRGELHLAILIETMRREGYEFQVSNPEALRQQRDRVTYEPYELLSIDTREEYIGPLSENLAPRLARMSDMRYDGDGNVHLEYKIPTRGLIGFNSYFLRVTRGNGVMNSLFLGYEPLKGEVQATRSGALVASEQGVAVTYGLNNAQIRGSTFVEPGTEVYEGMIVGLHSREDDLVVNICKEKKLTNVRSSTSDIAVQLTPAIIMSLEECLDFLNSDELLEVTPSSLRLRKKFLSKDQRRKYSRDRVSV